VPLLEILSKVEVLNKFYYIPFTLFFEKIDISIIGYFLYFEYSFQLLLISYLILIAIVGSILISTTQQYFLLVKDDEKSFKFKLIYSFIIIAINQNPKVPEPVPPLSPNHHFFHFAKHHSPTAQVPTLDLKDSLQYLPEEPIYFNRGEYTYIIDRFDQRADDFISYLHWWNSINNVIPRSDISLELLYIVIICHFVIIIPEVFLIPVFKKICRYYKWQHYEKFRFYVATLIYETEEYYLIYSPMFYIFLINCFSIVFLFCILSYYEYHSADVTAFQVAQCGLENTLLPLSIVTIALLLSILFFFTGGYIFLEDFDKNREWYDKKWNYLYTIFSKDYISAPILFLIFINIYILTLFFIYAVTIYPIFSNGILYYFIVVWCTYFCLFIVFIDIFYYPNHPWLEAGTFATEILGKGAVPIGYFTTFVFLCCVLVYNILTYFGYIAPYTPELPLLAHPAISCREFIEDIYPQGTVYPVVAHVPFLTLPRTSFPPIIGTDWVIFQRYYNPDFNFSYDTKPHFNGFTRFHHIFFDIFSEDSKVMGIPAKFIVSPERFVYGWWSVDPNEVLTEWAYKNSSIIRPVIHSGEQCEHLVSNRKIYDHVKGIKITNSDLLTLTDISWTVDIRAWWYPKWACFPFYYFPHLFGYFSYYIGHHYADVPFESYLKIIESWRREWYVTSFNKQTAYRIWSIIYYEVFQHQRILWEHQTIAILKDHLSLYPNLTWMGFSTDLAFDKWIQDAFSNDDLFDILVQERGFSYNSPVRYSYFEVDRITSDNEIDLAAELVKELICLEPIAYSEDITPFDLPWWG